MEKIMKTKYLTIVILLTLLAACTPLEEAAPSSSAPGTTIEPPGELMGPDTKYIPGDCPFSLEPEITAQFNPECGRLVVPEDRSDPESKEINLAVAYFHSPNTTSNDIPVVFIEGGPGVSALKPLQFTITRFLPLLQDHDVIFYDQRGTGFSLPTLDCPEHTANMRQSLEEQISPEETIDQQIQVFEACHLRLVEEGYNLEMYNALQSASDLEDLRIALGIETWDLYSVSYGTRVALEAMRQYPDGIHSVVLDSVLPPDVDPIAEAPLNVGRALRAFFESCSADPYCAEAFPDLEGLFYATAAQLNDQPVQVPVSNMLTGDQYNSIVDGNVLTRIVTQSLYSSEILPILPMMIYEVSQGNYSKISSLRSSFITNTEFLSQGKYYTVLCHQEAPFSSPEKVSAAIKEYPELEDYFSVSISHSKGTFDFCKMWDPGEANPDQNEPVISTIPALLLGDKMDPSTPVGWSQQAAQNLENSFFIEIETAGHASSLSLPCPNSIVLDFLDNPTNQPDTSCIADLRLEFTIPTQLEKLTFIETEVPEHSIKASVPEGWIAVQPEYYVSPDKSIELVISWRSDLTAEEFLAQWSAAESIGTTEYNQLSWEIYPFSIPAKEVAGFIATSSTEDGFYHMLIVGRETLHQALFESVFLPVLQSFRTTE
jgi:pimeloyl-ACP methyl ester carboxylesterase